MKPDPPPLYEHGFAEQYDSANTRGLTGWVMRAGHRLLEESFGPQQKFDRVIEVGVGTGAHFEFVRHAYDEYLMTDSNQAMLDVAQSRYPASTNVRHQLQNAAQLDLPDHSFDRLIASHVLEHLTNPHIVLREWCRVLKTGGMLSLILPCDPGLLWRFGRTLGPRRQATRRGFAYDYVMARDHVNSITNLLALVRYYWDDRREVWWPSRVPFSDANLIYVANVRV